MPEQIKRLVFVFAIFIAFFLVMRYFLRPASFGELGHYRAKSIQENEVRELHYAGSDRCSKCHDDIRLDKELGFHKNLKCEACHGPGLKHVLYANRFKDGGHLPDSLVLYKPGERKDCAICHQKNAARIKIRFDTINNSMVHQVNTMEHHPVNKKTNEILKCIDCHNPHQP